MDSSTASTHNPPQGETILKTIAIFAILYLFLVSIGMIGNAFKGMGKEFAVQLIQSNAGPLIGLFIGILATSIIQSSSTTTSLVVGMVAAGTFGDDFRIAGSLRDPSHPPRGDLIMFIPFFQTLRDHAIPVSLREYLSFLEAMRADLITYDPEGFYYLARAAMVKDERNLDKFDRAFSESFKGLEAIGSNLFAETEASGPSNQSTPGLDGLGTVRQGYLEESTVDAVREITELIEAQRGYELNAKVISAADQMLGATTQVR